MSARPPWDDWLGARMGRGELKRYGSLLDRDDGLRTELIKEVNRRGRGLPEDANTWSGKKLLRWARDREAGAREGANLIANDQGFDCLHCGESVPPLGRTSRDHCPACLWSRHVDVVPGDRKAGCRGLQRPVGAALRNGAWRIRYVCERCGAQSECKVAMEGERPDVWASVISLAALEGES